MKRSSGIELFTFSIEKILKKAWKVIFKNMWEPCVIVREHCKLPQHPTFWSK